MSEQAGFRCHLCRRTCRGPHAAYDLSRHLQDDHGVDREVAYWQVMAAIYPEEAAEYLARAEREKANA